MRRFTILNLLIMFFYCAEAQTVEPPVDTVMLNEVVAVGELRKFQAGAKITPLPSTQINIAQSGGIENILRRFTPVYIKSDAGGLSTIHVRGTSASHTTVNFGGININSITLGQSNLSGIPLFLFDGLNLQYGSSSTINGSGAIGGAVYLGLGENWTNGLKINAKTLAGSFGEWMGGAKIYTGNGKFESVTRAYYYWKENNFPFKNYYTGNIGNKGPVDDVQHGASMEDAGFIQELNYRFNPESYLKSAVWAGSNWYQVQPNMQSNYHYSGTAEIDNKNLRIWTEYVNSEGRIRFKTGAGYVYEMQVYDKIETQKIGAHRFISNFQASAELWKRSEIKAGVEYKYLNPDVYTYSDSVIDYENNLDLYLSSYFQVIKNLRISVNLRQAFVTGFEAPFTPSAGAEYLLNTGNNSLLKFTTALSRSFRVPTFNDRYWGTQGNPTLKPEKGKHAELGGFYKFNDGSYQISVGVNGFYMDIENWIEWRNFGVWRAENVQEVVSKGLEVQAGLQFNAGEVKTEISANYTFNPVEAVETSEENGLTGRQMNYAPLNIANTSFNIKYKKWNWFVDGTYTGWVYTDDFGHKLSDYFIANCGASYDWKIGKHQVETMLMANNLLDTDYQSQKYYAMPGRSFQLSLKYILTNNKNH